jgi:MFS family permease
VFFVGVLPALFTLWVRRNVEEPQMWLDAKARRNQSGRPASATHGTFAGMFKGSLGRLTVAVTVMNGATLFGWWGLNLWLPGYLSIPVEDGGIGLGTYAMSGLVLAMQVGMWFGYITFGFVGDAFGRKRAYLVYLLLAAVLLPLYGVIRHPLILLFLGPLVAFFGTGYLSGFGALTAEIYPTEIRATAQGFTYNMGRIASALAPLAVGSLAQSQGFGLAFGLTGAAFLFAAITWYWIPDTTGRALV